MINGKASGFDLIKSSGLEESFFSVFIYI